MSPSTVERQAANGGREIVGQFGPGPEQLIGATYVPRPAPIGGLVLAPSICNDFLRSYRREVVLARQLAHDGIAVQRFHYRGTGNSAGDELDLTFDRMIEDITVARARLVEVVGTVPLAFLGTRYGALTAAAAAGSAPHAPLVLIEPTVSGDRFFRETWRAPIAHAIRDGVVPTTRHDLLSQLETEGCVDVLGHTVGHQLYRSSLGRTLVDELGHVPRPVLLVQLGGPSGLRADNERLLTTLHQRGFPVDVEITGDEQAWWFFQEDEAPPVEQLPAVAAWLVAKLTEASETPTPNLPDRVSSVVQPEDRVAQPEETPGFFSTADEELFGILTSPVGEARGSCAVLLSGGSWLASCGRNRMWVHLARSLARDGFHALRLDYHGVGESTGNTSTFRLDAPFVDDTVAACGWARDQGVRGTILLGSCFGARTALATATVLDDVDGVAAFPVPVRDFAMGDRIASLPTSMLARKALRPHVLLGLFRAEHRRAYLRVLSRKWRRWQRRHDEGRPASGRFEWVSPILLEQLRSLVEREIPVLLVFGADDDFFQDFQRGCQGPLGDLMNAAGDLIAVRVVPGKTHGLGSTAVQEAVVDELEQWLAKLDVSAVGPDRASMSLR
jgi:alpha/beta superfamily hydrolase